MLKESLVKSFFTPEELALIDPKHLPGHVAIIMDGNRRWERAKSLFGHGEGAKTLLNTVQAAIECGIRVLTVYGFSTETWSRPSTEIASLFSLFEEYLSNYVEKMCELGIRFHTIGDRERLPSRLKKILQRTSEATASCDKIDFVVATSYGARDELRRAFTRMHEDLSTGALKKEALTEATIASYLDTSPFSDPDLLIRTSGEMRLSNFLLWQLAYTEIHVTEILWPDFKASDLLKAICDFQKRKRRFGR